MQEIVDERCYLLIGSRLSSGYREVEKSNPIHAVPSVLDLTNLGSPTLEVPSFLGQDDVSATPSPTSPTFEGHHGQHHLHIVGTASARPKQGKKSKTPGLPVKELHPIHYDIDVLTKVGVYAGIGYIATYVDFGALSAVCF